MFGPLAARTNAERQAPYSAFSNQGSRIAAFNATSVPLLLPTKPYRGAARGAPTERRRAEQWQSRMGRLSGPRMLLGRQRQTRVPNGFDTEATTHVRTMFAGSRSRQQYGSSPQGAQEAPAARGRLPGARIAPRVPIPTAVSVARYGSFLAIIAQAMRAILLASATATTLTDRRSISFTSHG